MIDKDKVFIKVQWGPDEAVAWLICKDGHEATLGNFTSDSLAMINKVADSHGKAEHPDD